MADNCLSSLKYIKMLVLDVDGVLTDGGIFYCNAEQSMHRFYVHDGLGIKSLKNSGIIIAVISSRTNKAVIKRCKELGITELYQGVENKVIVLNDLLIKYSLKNSEVAYIGDDLADLPVLKQVGLPIAVANAVFEVKQVATYITAKSGGDGAVREVCDLIANSISGKSSVIGVIPARYDSTRFPGKPLAVLDGYPLVYHVYKKARKARLDDVIIATDDERILEKCQDLDCNVVLTSKMHLTGTDRTAEVAEKYDADCYINIQGDEPLIAPDLISKVAQVLKEDLFVDIVTARKKVTDHYEINNPNVVKVIVNINSKALYFSRAAIPYYSENQGEDGMKLYYKHIGIYGYKKAALMRLTDIKPSKLEVTESLEQLRALENGFCIKVLETDYDSIGVDTPDDLERVRRMVGIGNKEV